MRFIKTEDLKTGMRLARPIYNKDGVLLYERNSKLTHQGIVSVRNFGLLGIFTILSTITTPFHAMPLMTGPLCFCARNSSNFSRAQSGKSSSFSTPRKSARFQRACSPSPRQVA